MPMALNPGQREATIWREEVDTSSVEHVQATSKPHNLRPKTVAIHSVAGWPALFSDAERLQIFLPPAGGVSTMWLGHKYVYDEREQISRSTSGFISWRSRESLSFAGRDLWSVCNTSYLACYSLVIELVIHGLLLVLWTGYS